jgi:hypothetical protein
MVLRGRTMRSDASYVNDTAMIGRVNGGAPATHHQQPDEETMQRVLREAPKLLSRPVRQLEVAPTATPGDAVDPREDHRNAG